MSVAIEDYKNVKAQVARLSYHKICNLYPDLAQARKEIAKKDPCKYDHVMVTEMNMVLDRASMLLSTAIRVCTMSEICDDILKEGEGTRSDFEHIIARINLTIFSIIGDFRKKFYEIDLSDYEELYDYFVSLTNDIGKPQK